MRNGILTLIFGLLWIGAVQAQAGATLEVLTPDVCVPGKVSLRVINCNSCVSYEWEVVSGTGFKFAGSDYSTITSDTGWIDVSVKLKTKAGAIILLSTKKAIYGRKSPVVKLNYNKSVFCSGADTLVATDNTPNIKTRDWLIDGKVYYNGPKQLTYPLPPGQGYKSIYLLVRDSWDCKGKLLDDSAISVWDSIKATILASSRTGCAPAKVNFIFTADTGVQRINSVLWGFQNGLPAISTARSPRNISYANGDTNDVQLRLVSDKGCIYNYPFNNFINFGDSSLLSISLPKNKFCANELVTATVSNTKTTKALWTFQVVKTSSDTLRGNKITFQFIDTGKAKIKVIEDFNGCISEATYKNTITVEGPLAAANTDNPFYCSIPKTLNYTNTSIPFPGGTFWQWKLYDSSMNLVASNSANSLTTFSYNTTKGMKYALFLKATGTNGCSDSIFYKPINSFGHIDTNFTITPNPTCPGKSITAIPKAGPGSNVFPNAYQWWFYDSKGKAVFTSNALKPSYTYNSAGDYSVKMKVSNADGCLDSITLKDTIHIKAPVLNFKVSDSFVCRYSDLFVSMSVSPKNLNFAGQWMLKNIDSMNADYYANGDSAIFRPEVTGRYNLYFTLSDTSKGGCVFNYTYPYKIKVSGIEVAISVDKAYGCVPLNVNLTSKIRQNVNYKKLSNSIQYQWKSSDSLSVLFNTPQSQNTSAKVVNKKNYYVSLMTTNESGCQSRPPFLVVDAEFKSDFYVNGDVHCVGQVGKIQNRSTYWTTSVQYESDPSVIFTPSKNVPEPEVVFTKKGVYSIRQIATAGSCVDTSYAFNIVIEDIVADFSTPDSISYCAPRLINIFNNTIGAVENYWTFGDGDTAKTFFNDLAGHLYKKNKTRPGYDVRLIAINQYGCRDTLLKKGYIRVIGPIPDFSIKNITGCEPLNVSFINKSLDYSRMYLDYDNGVVVDSNVLLNYKYRVTNKALINQKFLPRVLLYDSFGCSALAYSSDTILVKKSAEAQHAFTSIYYLRGTEGCANDLLVKFTNKSKFFVKTWWDFDDDKVIDMVNQNNPNFLYTKPGVFKPVIIAENINGCRDTFQRDSITVWDPPVADFIQSTDTSCAINPIKFTSTSKFTHPAASYNWNFGEILLLDDTSTLPSASYKFTTPFNHSVKLSITDSKGCASTVVKNTFINDTAGPQKPELAFITVRNDQFVDFYWRKSNLGNYFQYHTYLDSLGLWQRYQSYNRSDTVFSVNHGNEVFNRRFCYTLRVEDTCLQNGQAAVSHCTIVLRDTAANPFSIDLKWLAYDWWGNDLSHYEIFRKDQGSNNYQKITEIKSNKLTYTDSFLCDKTYCYYVEAVHKNREYRSRSNTTCNKPIYTKPDSFIHTTLVTVLNNNSVKVNWEKYYQYYRNGSYQLERSSNGLLGSFSTVTNEKTTSAIDYGANVQDRINYYRVLFKDHCGTLSRPGINSNTIWLRINTQSRTKSQLLWNPYSYWHSGVRNYVVQLKGSDGVFKDFKTVSPNTLLLDSLNVESFKLDSICFRLYAVKDSTSADTSWSNEVCIVPSSYLHVPTAFSPDANNLNEEFKAVGGFLRKTDQDPNNAFEFKIYNAWGQIVFESETQDKGWDGTLGGKKCPAGLYIWQLKALGFDGVPYRLNGTVYLIR